MRISVRWVLVVVLAGCTKTPTTFPEQAKEIVENDTWLGQLDADLMSVRGHEKAYSARTEHWVTFSGYDGAQMCVTTSEELPYSMGSKEPDAWVAQGDAQAKKVQLTFGAYDSLAAVPAAFPPPTPTTGGVKDHERLVRHNVSPSLKSYDSYYIRIDYENCAPAPTITASTRFITLHATSKKGVELFVWKLTAAFTGAGSSTDQSPAAAPPPSETAPPASDAANGTTSVIDAMKEKGGFLGFLTIVTCAGKDAELASAGPFTVLAPTDSTIKRLYKPKQRKAMVADPATCLAIYSAHVAKGATTRATLQAKKLAKVEMLDGTTHELTADDATRGFEAANGVVYTVDTVQTP